MKKFVNYQEMKANEINFALGTDRQGKATIQMFFGDTAADVALISPACVTNWPRVTGDGNFGTMWGPTDIQKAKFTLDLTDAYINETENAMFTNFADKLTEIDERLLDFVQANQLKILGRKNLSREECKMLQIRTVRPKYDKVTGALAGHSVGRIGALNQQQYHPVQHRGSEQLLLHLLSPSAVHGRYGGVCASPRRCHVPILQRAQHEYADAGTEVHQHLAEYLGGDRHLHRW